MGFFFPENEDWDYTVCLLEIKLAMKIIPFTLNRAQVCIMLAKLYLSLKIRAGCYEYFLASISLIKMGCRSWIDVGYISMSTSLILFNY